MNDGSNGLVDRAKSRVGTVLRDKWRLDRLLGVGGMAAVYAATHRNGSRGAVKMLHTELSIDSDVKRRFLREGYVANAVEHPGTVKALDDDVAEDGSAFIVLELLEGETLEALAGRWAGPMPLAVLLPLVDQLLDVLAAAHARGIVHRDIKPENVFVTTAGRVKLLDFGIARLKRHQGSMATMSGAMLGTPAFMPHEQALGRTDEVDARSDLWAVGATLFSLLAGRNVHVTNTLNEQLVAHAAWPAPSLATAVAGLPPALVAVVDRALAFEKANRWQSATEMQQALRGALATGATEVPATLSSVAVVGDTRGGLAVGGQAPAPVAPSTAVVGAVTLAPDLVTMPRRRQPWRVRAAVAAGLAIGGLLIVLVRFGRGPGAGDDGGSRPRTSGATTAIAPENALAVPASTPSVEPSVPLSATPAEAPASAPSVASATAPAAKSPATTGTAKAPAPTAIKPPPAQSDWLDRQH